MRRVDVAGRHCAGEDTGRCGDHNKSSPHLTSISHPALTCVIDNSDKGVWNVGTEMKESPMPCVHLCLVLRFHTAIPYSYHSQSLPSIRYIMDVYKMSFSICKKSLYLCGSEEYSGSTAHSWTRQQAGCQWRAEYCCSW